MKVTSAPFVLPHRPALNTYVPGLLSGLIPFKSYWAHPCDFSCCTILHCKRYAAFVWRPRSFDAPKMYNPVFPTALTTAAAHGSPCARQTHMSILLLIGSDA